MSTYSVSLGLYLLQNEDLSNKAFHRTSHKVRRPVNADVLLRKSYEHYWRYPDDNR
jgi:hypothetical protein